MDADAAAPAAAALLVDLVVAAVAASLLLLWLLMCHRVGVGFLCRCWWRRRCHRDYRLYFAARAKRGASVTHVAEGVTEMVVVLRLRYLPRTLLPLRLLLPPPRLLHHPFD